MAASGSIPLLCYVNAAESKDHVGFGSSKLAASLAEFFSGIFLNVMVRDVYSTHTGYGCIGKAV